MIQYIGLDFEASGSNPWDKHVPIQIGLTTGQKDFEALIGRWNWGEWEWSEEAFGVHGITKEELVDCAPVWVVDLQAATWLIEQIGYTNRMFNITVGWNVAGYDRQFITRWMPNLNRLLSYRTVDLNTMLFYLVDSEEEYKGRKEFWKKFGEESVGPGQAHNALYDAKTALAIWQEMKTNES